MLGRDMDRLHFKACELARGQLSQGAPLPELVPVIRRTVEGPFVPSEVKPRLVYGGCRETDPRSQPVSTPSQAGQSTLDAISQGSFRVMEWGVPESIVGWYGTAHSP